MIRQHASSSRTSILGSPYVECRSRSWRLRERNGAQTLFGTVKPKSLFYRFRSELTQCQHHWQPLYSGHVVSQKYQDPNISLPTKMSKRAHVFQARCSFALQDAISWSRKERTCLNWQKNCAVQEKLGRSLILHRITFVTGTKMLETIVVLFTEVSGSTELRP